MAKKRRIKQIDWDKYSTTIKDFVDVDSGKQKVYWLKKMNIPTMFGEDKGNSYHTIELEALIQYNYIRVWPMNESTVSGELPGENQVMYVTSRQIEELGYLKKSVSNPTGYWDFNWSEDRFIINGIVYTTDGDTHVSQAKDEPLLFFIVLRREDPTESERLLQWLERELGTYLRDSDSFIIHDVNEEGIRTKTE